MVWPFQDIFWRTSYLMNSVSSEPSIKSGCTTERLKWPALCKGRCENADVFCFPTPRSVTWSSSKYVTIRWFSKLLSWVTALTKGIMWNFRDSWKPVFSFYQQFLFPEEFKYDFHLEQRRPFWVISENRQTVNKKGQWGTTRKNRRTDFRGKGESTTESDGKE